MNLWAVVASAVVLSSLLSFLLIPGAWRAGLLDKPCDRKQHNGSVPLVGGLSVYATAMVVIAWCFPLGMDLRMFMVAATLMVFIGVLDDRFDLSVRLRIGAQLIASGIVVFGAGLYVADLGDLFGFGVIELGLFSIPFTLLAIMAAMNAYNMIDGIDGLLGTMAIVAFAGIAVLAVINHQPFPQAVAVVIIGALIPFLVRNIGIRNRKIRKIFMGDAGSMFIGFTIVWLLTILTHPQQLFEAELINEVVNNGSQTSSVRPVAVLWLIAVPLMDMLAIMVRRIVKRQSPFKPDRDHLHHIFMRAGFTPREALAVIATIAIVLAALGIILEVLMVPEVIVFLLYLVVFSVYGFMLKNAWTLVSWVRHKRGIEKA